MNCPHCGETVSLFLREMNLFTKDKACPHCQKRICLFVNFKVFALLLVPAIAVAVLLKPLFIAFEMGIPLVIGVITGALILLSIRLKESK